MKVTFAVLFAAIFASIGMANAADGCGPGCHAARNGGCVVDGWDRGARVRNECPVGAHPRPPCYRWFVWSRRDGACIISPN